MKHPRALRSDGHSAPARWSVPSRAPLLGLMFAGVIAAALPGQDLEPAAAGARRGGRAESAAERNAPFLISTTGGRAMAAERIRCTGGGAPLQWSGPGADADTRSLPWAELLGIHGAAPDGDATPHAIRLVDGGQLRGRIVGGDDYGDMIALEAPAFGTLQVPLDSIQAVGFDGGPAPDWRATDEGDDVLYVAARLGADSIVGAIYRMDQAGVWFARSGEDEPEHYPFRQVIGLGIAAAPPPERTPEALLLTRYGDRVALTGVTIGDGKVGGEGLLRQQFTANLTQLAALTPVGSGRTHLSDLVPVGVVEHSYEDPAHPLYPHRMDQNVLGAPLVAQGRCHGKGIGVHAASSISWRVPPGRTRFVGWVAIDDSALALLPRASVQVSVLRNGKAVGEPRELSAGDPPLSLGVNEVAPGDTLTLTVGFGAGLDLADRVLWLHPVLLP